MEPQRYFAYGSNMNPRRVRQRGLRVRAIERAAIPGLALCFDKSARDHAGRSHANLVAARDARTEGVLYTLCGEEDILRMDGFERAPINYSREAVVVETPRGPRRAWTYFANPAVRRGGLRPDLAYLEHLRSGRPFHTPEHRGVLARWPTA